MKNVFLLLSFCVAAMTCMEVSAQAVYNIQFDFYEKGDGDRIFYASDQGPCDVDLDFENYPTIHYGDDIKGYQSSEGLKFPATAQVKKFNQRFYYGGETNMDYTSELKDVIGQSDIFNVQSYYKKRHDLRPYGPNIRWIAQEGQYFDVTIWPDNLDIVDKNPHVLLENDTVTIFGTTGFAPPAYTWRYSVDGLTNGFIDMPVAFQKKSTISVKGIDLLQGSNFKYAVDNDKPVYIQLFTQDKQGNIVQYGEKKTLNPKFYAPRISFAVGQQALCSYSTKTNAIIQFDKAIGAGNKLKVTNYKGLNSGDSYVITDDSLNSSLQYVLKNVDVDFNYRFKVSKYGDLADHDLQKFYVDQTEKVYNTFSKPTPLLVGLLGRGVYCYGGQDGTLIGYAKDGTSPYTYQYSTVSGTSLNTTHNTSSLSGTWYKDDLLITALGPGTYQLMVTDKNGCSISKTVALTQPATPLTIKTSVVTDASGFGLPNGSIEVKLQGGTSAPYTVGQYGPPYLVVNVKGTNGTYDYEIHDFDPPQSNGESYVFRFLTAGTYSFRAEDMALTNFKSAIKDSLGCLAKTTFTIVQPPLLQSSIVQTDTIRCFSEKTATLIAHAKGGKPKTTGSYPYVYQWSFSKNGVSPYSPVATADSILTNKEAGFYKVTVTDKNNNVSYSAFQVKEPTSIACSLVVKNVTCLNWTDGAVTLSNLSGGKAPYSVLWSGGQRDLSLANLAKGTYPVTVTDASGCILSQTAHVKDTLNDVHITENLNKQPFCFGESNGSLAVHLDVPSLPYTIAWNTGSTDTLLKAIKADTYTIQVLDGKNCLTAASFVVRNPAAIPLNLPSDRYLCVDQVAAYDLTVKDSVYAYQWKGPNLQRSEAKATLSEAGLYVATITDGKGCQVKDSVTIHRVNETIASEFVVPSQVLAGEEVLITNITQVRFQDTAYWEINDPRIEIKALSLAYATVVFKEAGVYDIGLSSHLGNCVKLLKKHVQVLAPTFEHHPSNTSSSFIENFEVRPNPNDGRFEVMIRLKEIASVKLRFLDYYSKSEIEELQFYDAKEYVIPMQVNVAPGSYILFLETPNGVRVMKVIIM